MPGSLNRRAILQSGALAAGSLAFGGLITEAAPAGTPWTGPVPSAPVAGRVVGWLRIEIEHGAALQVVELDAACRPVQQLASLRLPDASFTALNNAAMDIAATEVARSWAVPTEAVRLAPGQIVSTDGGRAVPFSIWTDIA